MTDSLRGDAFQPLSPQVRLALTLGPICGFGLILLVAGLVVSPGAAGFMASLAAGTFVGGGKLVILAGAVEQAPVGRWVLAALVVYMDLATAMIVMGGIHHLYRLPGAGQRIATARESGWRVLKRNPWMYRIAWLGLAGFIAVPFNGTGALVGSVIGRLVGLSRISVLTATGSGSLLASLAVAFAGGVWAERINALAAEPLLGVAVIALVIALTVLGSRWALGGAQHETQPPP